MDPDPDPECEEMMVPGAPGGGVDGVEVEEPNTIRLVEEKIREPSRLLFEYCSSIIGRPTKRMQS
jgi:hypothetical protein